MNCKILELFSVEHFHHPNMVGWNIQNIKVHLISWRAVTNMYCNVLYVPTRNIWVMKMFNWKEFQYFATDSYETDTLMIKFKKFSGPANSQWLSNWVTGKNPQIFTTFCWMFIIIHKRIYHRYTSKWRWNNSILSSFVVEFKVFLEQISHFRSSGFSMFCPIVF